VVTDVPDDQGVERAAFAAGESAVVEDAGDLGVSVVIKKSVDHGDGAGRGLPELPGGLGHWEDEGVVLPPGQADVRGDGLGGSGYGHVGEQ
jgi:hypothetical protein